MDDNPGRRTGSIWLYNQYHFDTMSTSNWDEIWPTIDARIQDQAKSIAESGKFDDAILASLRYVESAIQDRINSTSIGQALLNEAFDGSPPKIQIGSARDAEWVKSIFAGAFGFVRNDRAHKATPAYPCISIGECSAFLQFAGFLLRLLERDMALLPSVASVEVVAHSDRLMVVLHGAQLGRVDKVLAAGRSVPATFLRADMAEYELAVGFVGELPIYSPAGLVHSAHVDGRPVTDRADNVYEVVDANVPLYPHGDVKPIEDALTAITKAELGRPYLRTLMVHGARAVVRYATNKNDAFSGWLRRLLARRHKNIAVVAVANRNARIAWALLTQNRTLRSDYASS